MFVGHFALSKRVKYAEKLFYSILDVQHKICKRLGLYDIALTRTAHCCMVVLKYSGIQQYDATDEWSYKGESYCNIVIQQYFVSLFVWS